MMVRYSAAALTLTLALASQPALAQGHRGGSHGGSAVPRSPSAGPRPGAGGGMHYGSRPGYAPHGSVAEQRHPRPGTGHGYGYGYGHGYHPGHGYYGGHSHYRPYYGYGPYYSYYPYYPYYSYWPGVSLSFGWGYGSNYVGAYYGSPSYSAGVYAPYDAEGSDDSGAPPPRAREAAPPYEGRAGQVRLEVRPDDTSVYVDNEFHGTAREARSLSLPPGRHLIELVRPGYAVERREVTVVSGQRQDVLVELLRP